MLRINIGCGRTPTRGWRNFDNSPSLWLARISIFPAMLRGLRFLDKDQYRFIEFARDNNIEYGDITRGLPVPSGVCDALYSSHMLEHLDRNGARRFLEEAYRVLRPGGILRIAVPDLRKQIDIYRESRDADAFMEAMYVCVSQPGSLTQKLKLLLVGTRHHQWMYDGESLTRLLGRHGFVGTEITPAGKTRIPDPGHLNLQERSAESVYVEAEKPAT